MYFVLNNAVILSYYNYNISNKYLVSVSKEKEKLLNSLQNIIKIMR